VHAAHWQYGSKSLRALVSWDRVPCADWPTKTIGIEDNPCSLAGRKDVVPALE
jgi:hypothetical protein